MAAHLVDRLVSSKVTLLYVSSCFEKGTIAFNLSFLKTKTNNNLR